MSPRTEEQNREIRENRKGQIMDAALKLFTAKNYSQVSIAEIAKTVKISKGLIYNYFESKEELIFEIFKSGMQKIVNLFDKDDNGILTDDELSYFIEESLNLMKENIGFWRLYLQLMMQQDVYETIEDKAMKLLAPIIETATKYFESQGSDSPQSDAMILMATLDGISMNYIMHPNLFPLEEAKKKLHAMYK